MHNSPGRLYEATRKWLGMHNAAQAQVPAVGYYDSKVCNQASKQQVKYLAMIHVTHDRNNCWPGLGICIHLCTNTSVVNQMPCFCTVKVCLWAQQAGSDAGRAADTGRLTTTAALAYTP